MDKRKNIHSSIWGPVLWKSLYFIAMSYPIENPSTEIVGKFKTYFTDMKYFLPCEKCRAHYMMHIQKDPVKNHLRNRETLLRWLVDLNCNVNKSLGKKPVFYQEKMNELLTETDIRQNNMENFKPIVYILLISLGLYTLKKYLKK